MACDNYKKIGDNIRKWRSVKGIKQGTLADEIGLARSTLSRIENNKAIINVLYLHRIAVFLNIKPALLLDDPSEILHAATEET